MIIEYRSDEVLYKTHTNHRALLRRTDEIDILKHGTEGTGSTLNDSLAMRIKVHLDQQTTVHIE
jgi:hypothetical protein